jgi:mRNA-degrading endonuclease HigB of HigAB toxin-antitoxin module
LSSLALIVFFKRTPFNALMNAIRAWFAVAAKARWANPAEIKRQFGGTGRYTQAILAACSARASAHLTF